MSGKTTFQGANSDETIVSLTNPLPVILGAGSAVQAITSTALNIASAAITATTTSADLVVGAYKELSVDVNISAVTGTTPSYTLSINRKGVDGVYYPIYTGSSQTVTAKISLSLGVGASTNTSFGSTIQIVETVTGTTPNFTRSLSIIGK